ncbi:MAG: HAMP domain-containing histidine kinase [bacterium]|nr:HAMP domain-containing histidine kinase [bacterium]
MARRSTRSSSGHTILVVDDQEDTLLSVQSLLEREGHRVLLADGGDAALAVLREHDVDLMILDYLMPRMTGAELVRLVRRFDPYLQIVLQTGYAGDRPPRAMLAELDIQGYHDKADDPEKLLTWVAVALKAHRLVATLRERERLQSELVANCSHEFRTPLNIVSGYASLLANGDFGPLPTDAQAPLASIQQAVTNLNDLVNDFLAHAKLEASVAAAAPDWLDVGELVRELETLASVLLEDKPITFRAVWHGTPARLLADGTKLRTVLRNLIGNAAKYTDRGSVTLRVTDAGDVVRFAVEDTGPGIAPAHQETIFEPFRQIDGSSTRTHGGVGLGLALARKLTRLLGGDLVVHSTPGAGSTFTLTLPAADVERGSVDRLDRAAAG